MSISLNNLLGFCLDLCWINRSIQSDWPLDRIVSSKQWIFMHLSVVRSLILAWMSVVFSIQILHIFCWTYSYMKWCCIWYYFFRTSNCLLLVYRNTAIFFVSWPCILWLCWTHFTSSSIIFFSLFRIFYVMLPVSRGNFILFFPICIFVGVVKYMLDLPF